MFSDQVGASDSAMTEAVANFHARVADFEAAAQQISTDVTTLQSGPWVGAGSDQFGGAMGKWNTDINNVTMDLQSMSTGIQQSNAAIQGTDQMIANGFAKLYG